MYKIAILDEDKAYLERLMVFLEEHYRDRFEISAAGCLDDLDQEVTQYNALFFSDDVAVDAALFPEDIIVGYLTERSEEDEQYINKYQSMEQIYRRMLKLCEEQAGTDSADSAACAKRDNSTEEVGSLQAETVTADGETYRIYYIDDGQVDRLAVRMLAGNRIRGLFQTEYQNGGVRIRITGMQSLYEYIQKNNTPRGKKQLLKFFADMLATACSLEEYMLSADRLMLNPKEIYVNHAQDRVLIPYIPVKSDAPQDSRQWLELIQDMCSVLIEGCVRTEGGVQVKGSVRTEGGVQTKDSAQIEDSMQIEDRTQKKGGLVVKGTGEDAIAPDSQRPKESTKTIRKGLLAYMVRKRTQEKIVVNRSPFKLGKDASYVDYYIADNPAVSRNHADIVRKPDGFYLIDKGSLNHTFINGRKLNEGVYGKLENGCLVQLADEVFEFKLKQEKNV